MEGGRRRVSMASVKVRRRKETSERAVKMVGSAESFTTDKDYVVCLLLVSVISGKGIENVSSKKI